MKSAFNIFVGYASLGFLYAPGISTLLGLLFIVFSCAPFLVAARYEYRLRIENHIAPNSLIFWSIFLLGILNLVVIAVSVGASPLDLFSIDGFVSIAFSSTAKRYGEQGSSGSPILLALSLYLLYRIAAADALVASWKKVFGFIPLLLYTLLSTEKWPMYLSGIFFISGLLISRPFGEARNVLLKYLSTFAVIGVGLACLALVLRGFDGDIIELPSQLLHYVLAPLPAFGEWLITESTRQCCTFGAFSFIGIFNALGLVERESGVFSNNFTIYGLDTNIYTSWRYLVQDFSLIGPFILNSIMSASFIGFNQIKWSAASTSIRGFAIFSALLSLNITPFVHNSVAFAMVLSLFYSMYTTRFFSFKKFFFHL